MRVHVCCVVWVLRSALFSVGVEVSEGRCACDGLLGVLLSCIVGWRGGGDYGPQRGDVCSTQS